MKEKILKRLFFMFVIIMIIIAVIIVKKQTQNEEQNNIQVAEQKAYGTELKIGISALDTFDPIKSNNKNVQDICKLIYEPLLTIDQNFKVQGILATEWAKTAENSYLIKLKQGVKWHNGNEFNSTDVKFTINKIKQEDNKSIYNENVKNISDVVIIDNYTIRLDLLETEALFEYNLIFPIECARDYNGDNIVIPSGTGIYKIYQMNPNQLELVRNPYKENAEEIQIKSIIIRNYETMGELYNDFKIGNIDVFNTDNINYSNYIGTLGYTIKNFYGREFNFLAMNTKNLGLYSIEVRKAINYALDKNMIVSTVDNGKCYPANYPLDYGSWLYKDENTSSGYNPEQSKKILEENGWEYKNEVWQKNINNQSIQLKFNLLVNSKDEVRLKVAENIKQQLEEIGIHINIVKTNSIQDYINNKNYDIALLQLNTGVAPDLKIFIGENNLVNYEDSEAIQILKELENIDDENLLKEKYNKLLEIYKKNIIYISLYFNNSTLVYNSKIAGNMNPTWYNVYNGIENWKIEI